MTRRFLEIISFIAINLFAAIIASLIASNYNPIYIGQPTSDIIGGIWFYGGVIILPIIATIFIEKEMYLKFWIVFIAIILLYTYFFLVDINL